MVTNEQVYEVLRKCYDPEIPVSLVDLGLIYDVQIEDDHVKVVMTLTARGCPAHSFISEQVRQQVAEIPEVKSATVQVVRQLREKSLAVVIAVEDVRPAVAAAGNVVDGVGKIKASRARPDWTLNYPTSPVLARGDS